MAEENEKEQGMEIPDSLLEKSETRKEKDASLNKRAFTSGFFFIMAQFCARGLTFAVTPIYSRLLTNSQYGIVRTYESWLIIAYTLMSLCLWRSVDVAKYDFRDKFNEYVSSVQTLSYIAIACFFGLCMIFKEQVQSFCDMDDLMFYTCFLYVFTYTSMLYIQRRDKQMLHYKFSTAATLLTIIPGTLLSIGLIYSGKVRGLTDQLVARRIIGYYTPQIIGGAVIAVVIFVQGRKVLYNKKYWRYGLAFSLPLIPEALSIQIMNQSDKIMVKKLVGDHATGTFSLATTISFIIWILEDSVWNAWIPWLYEKVSRKEIKDVERPWTAVMHMFGLFSWALVMLAPEEILILGGSRYREAIWLIAPMVTGTLFRFYSYSYSTIQNYHKNTKYVAAGTIGTMIVNVILNYVCILQFGYMAAAYTTMASYFILLLVQGILEYRITGMVIVPLRKTAAIAILYGVVNIMSMQLYNFPWYIRYVLLLAVALIALKIMLPQLETVLNMFRKKKA